MEVSALIESLRETLPRKGSHKSYNREKLKEIAEQLSIALETPGETCQRVSYYVRQSVPSIFCCKTLQVHPTYMLLPLVSLFVQPSFALPTD